jgi:hypothetical protein
MEFGIVFVSGWSNKFGKPELAYDIRPETKEVSSLPFFKERSIVSRIKYTTRTSPFRLPGI